MARPLTEGGISGTTLNLTFGDAVTELVTGTPYIIKWDGGNDIVSPVFSGVTIDATMHPYDSGEADGDSGWYTIDGRRLNGKPTRSGVYINNGVKVVIK